MKERENRLEQENLARLEAAAHSANLKVETLSKNSARTTIRIMQNQMLLHHRLINNKMTK